MYTQQMATVATLYFKQTLHHLVLEEVDLFLMSVGVPSAGDGGILRVPSGSSSFRNEGVVKIVGGDSFVRCCGDASPSAA